jgi:hypothetical protein
MKRCSKLHSSLLLVLIFCVSAISVDAQALDIMGDGFPVTGKGSRIWDRSWAVNADLSSTLQAVGGVGPFLWSLGGDVPPGMTITDTRNSANSRIARISGAARTAGTYSVAITVTDTFNGASKTLGPYDLVIGPTITFSAEAPTGGTIGRPFSTSFVVSGGTPSGSCVLAPLPVLECVNSGNLVTLTGTLTVAARSTSTQGFFQISLSTDNGLAYYSFPLQISNPLTIKAANTQVTMPVGFAYSSGARLDGSGTGPYVTRVTTGRIPPGTELVFDSRDMAIVSGTLLLAGTYNYTITVSDRWGDTASQDFSVVVTDYPLPRITYSPPPNGKVGEYYYYRFDVEGTTPMTWAVSSGALPAGIRLSGLGPAMEGIPTTAATTTFTLKITDGVVPPRTVQQNVTITISPATALVRTRTTFPNATAGVFYSTTATAAGGVPPYRWRSTNMPAGLSLAESGAISGILTSGDYRVTLTVTDATNATVTDDYVIRAVPPITTRSLRPGTVGVIYDPHIGLPLPRADGSTNTQDFELWAISSGSLPPGLTLSYGLLNGVPRVPGVFTFVAQWGDPNAGGELLPFSITIAPAEGVTAYSVVEKGAVVLSSNGANSDLVTGHGLLVPDYRNPTPSAAAFFEFRSGGVLVSETTVPASKLLWEGRIFAEVSPTVNTGIAFANLSSDYASPVDVTYIDSTGRPIGTTRVEVPVNGKIAAFLNEPPFNAPNNFVGSIQFRGVLRPIAVLALRGLTNERSEFLLTTLPVIPLAPTNAPIVIPQFAAGGGWSTQVILMNQTAFRLHGTIEFLDSGSSATPPRPVTLTVNGISGTSFEYSVAPNGVQNLIATADDGAVRVGSVRVNPVSGDYSPAGLLTYAFRSGGITLSETGLAVAESAESYRFFVESSTTPRIQTGFAIANPSAEPVTVDLTLVSLSGGVVGKVVLTLPGHGQSARYIHEIPDLRMPPNFRGLLVAAARSGSIVLSGIRGRYNERGDYFETTVAPVDSSAPGTNATKSFPHLVDGKGYRTTMVLFSGTSEQAGSGFVRIYNAAGNAQDIFSTRSLRADPSHRLAAVNSEPAP